MAFSQAPFSFEVAVPTEPCSLQLREYPTILFDPAATHATFLMSFQAQRFNANHVSAELSLWNKLGFSQFSEPLL